MEGQVWRLEASDAKRLRALEEENAKLKRLLADTMLDNAVRWFRLLGQFGG